MFEIVLVISEIVMLALFAVAVYEKKKVRKIVARTEERNEFI